MASLLAMATIAIAAAVVLWMRDRAKVEPVPAPAQQVKTIYDRIAEFGDVAGSRLRPEFERAGVHYPPSRMAIVAIKGARTLELWAANEGEELNLIRAYPVLGASGTLGPKLREGDRQVPEGIYRIELLNPNSLYHLSLRVSYPNDFDLVHAQAEGRTEPGTDIMIHGGQGSRGCLAVGDEAAEDLFVTAALTETRDIPMIIAPVDFRVRDFSAPPGTPEWTGDLYRQIKAELARFVAIRNEPAQP